MTAPSLEALRALGVLSALDERFARTVARIGRDERPEVMLAAALVSRDVGNGHACLDLRRMRDDRVVTDPAGVQIEALSWPALEPWRTALQTSPLVSAGNEVTPLVLDAKGRLYLRRYWEHEGKLAEALRARGSAVDPTLDLAVLRDGLRRLFPSAAETVDFLQHTHIEGKLSSPALLAGEDEGEGTILTDRLRHLQASAGVQDSEPSPRPSPAGDAGEGRSSSALGPQTSEARKSTVSAAASEPDWQRIAALMAVQRRLCVISGGPGTGKTYTVVKILALLVEQALHAGRRPPRVTLVAPTGKAAKRLAESIQRAKAGLNCTDAVKAAIPEDASTIHRCLGTLGGSTTRYRHDSRNPLVTDVVLVDEASMVDLALMSRLLQAVPAAARVILLGDKDQLASVEAGAVLGDICNSDGAPRHSRSLATSIRAVSADTIPLAVDAPEETGIWDCVVSLTRSYRYGTESSIGALASAINAGDSAAALEILESAADLARWEPRPGGALHAGFAEAVVRGFRPFLETPDAASRLRALDGFRVLCAHREGPYGLISLNQTIEETLRGAGLIQGDVRDFVGRPIIVTRNDYQVGLFNGDVGVMLAASDTDGQRAAFFVGAEGRERRLSPARLPPHETVFAMSVHKSQGSEFDEVIVVLPERLSPVVSRELLYTAVTRARRRVVIHATRDILTAAIACRVARASGLRDALWKDDAA